MTTTLASLGWDTEYQKAYRPYDKYGNRVGRVSRVDRGICTVLTSTGITRASLAGRMLGIVAKDRFAMPSVGDWAVIRVWNDDRSTIEAILPRRSAIVRSSADKTSQGQAIAVNIDTVAVVEALDPDPDSGRIERLLALAHESGAQPILVLTKADAVPDPALLACDFAGAAGTHVKVLTVSSETGEGIDELRGYVQPGHTLALLGASGAGKSTLVNRLVGTPVMTTRELRGDGRGRHTTTHRALVTLPTGGMIIDTPGLRVVGLFDRRPGDTARPADGLAHAFDDLEELAKECRFNDCHHATEPDCAINEALEAGYLPMRRFENWKKLQKEQAFERRRAEYRNRTARRRSRA